jgi:hypothetical protein
VSTPLAVTENHAGGARVRFEDGIKHVAEGWVTLMMREEAVGLVPEYVEIG